MPDFLEKLIEDARKRVREGYYDVRDKISHQPISFKRAIKSAQRNAIIAEIKPASPTRGRIRPDLDAIKAAERLHSRSSPNQTTSAEALRIFEK
jgi:indole-3-glycerol phosphate synthase